MRHLAVAAMALAEGADRPDSWPEGRHLEARRRRIITAPQLRLMLITAMVVKLKSTVCARATAKMIAP